LKKRDKSSEIHFVHSDLIRTIHGRATEKELHSLTELTFWEKMGFKNNTKRQIMMQKGK